MKWLIEKSRYLTYIAVLGLLVGSVAAFYAGAEKVVKVWMTALQRHESSNPTLDVLFESLDSFLVAIALIVVSVGLYDLFIGELDVPEWMLVDNLDDLKAKFSFVLIPIMAVKFVQKILQWESALETLYYGIAVSLVATALTVFNYARGVEKEMEHKIESEGGENDRNEDAKN